MRNMTKIALAGLVLLLCTSVSLAATPLQVPLQGVIRDNAGVPVVEDVFEVTFSLYDAVDAVDPVWTETWPPAGANCVDDPGACVHVVNGRFRLALGAHTPLGPEVFVASNGLWLGMKVETDPELDRRPLGSAPYALHAATAASASSLDCTGCIPPEALSNEAVLDILDTTLLAVQNAGYVHEGDLAAGAVPFDGAASELGATDVQGAIEELKALIEEKTGAGAGGVNEGAGQVISFPMSEGVPSYGTATQYVHMVNPATPKVITHLYGDQAAGGGGAGNLVVAYDFAPNQYSSGASGEAGDNSLHVDNPSLFNTANHVLVYQTRGGSGTTAGTWEVNAVLSVNGNNLLLVKDLENTYVTDDTAKAQVVLASSFGTLEVVGGGVVSPAAPLAADGSSGGIVYIRANQITVKNGGVIHADGAGFPGGIAGSPSGQGSSDCGAGVAGDAGANCSGGGVGSSFCASAGGGGNQTEGSSPEQAASCPAGPGSGGEANTDDADLLQMGGGGGAVVRGAGGAGGGLVVLGSKTIIVETGGRISAHGGAGAEAGSGGGAGGTVALYTEVLQDDGEVSVSGGAGGAGGGDWTFTPGYPITDVSFNTYSHGGGYSPFYDEFWYSEWAGNTVYRMQPETFVSLGQFQMPVGSIMSVWGMPDGGYLAGQWGGSGYIYRVDGPGGNQLWESDPIQHDTAGACFDGERIWTMDNYDSTLYELNPDNGDIVSTHGLSNIGSNSYGGLVCVPGRLYRTDDAGCIRVYDLGTKNHIDTQCGFTTINNTSFDGQFIYVSPNNNNVQKIQITSSNIYTPAVDGGEGGAGWLRQVAPIPGVVNESFPKGVRLLIDGNDVTASVGDPNGKGAGVYDPESGWGASGLDPWSSGPLDVTNVANWTLGEHTVQLKETGGAGGLLKANTYVIYPFTESTPPLNDTCSSPLALDPNNAPVVTSGTTEDVMGKTLATDANVEPGCGGQGGPDVVYRIDLAQRSLLHAAVVAPFPTRLYLRADSCVSGSQVYCADETFTTNPIEAGTYFLFVDSNAPIAKGDFTLAVSTTPAVLPANDTCDAAETLDFGDNGVASVTTSSIYSLDQYDGFCATEGNGPDVVYHFTTDQTHSVTVDFQADFSATTYLMNGACSGQGAFPSVCNQQGIPSQFLPAGEYWLIIDGNGEKVWGDYSLTVTLN